MTRNRFLSLDSNQLSKIPSPSPPLKITRLISRGISIAASQCVISRSRSPIHKYGREGEILSVAPPPFSIGGAEILRQIGKHRRTKVCAVGYENWKLYRAHVRGSKGKGEFHSSSILARTYVCVCVDCALLSEWRSRAGSRKTRVSLNISNELRAFSGKSFSMDWIFVLKWGE